MDDQTRASRAEPFSAASRTTPLVRGLGRYIADAPMPNQAYAYFVRSPHAFARIRSIDTAARAQRRPAWSRVLTAQGHGRRRQCRRAIRRSPGRNGTKLVVPIRPALAGERVMHIGEPVAMVVAETRAGRAGRRRIGRTSNTRS